MNYTDLRDLSKKEKKVWVEAIEDQTGYKFEDVLEGDPVMIPDYLFEEYAKETAEDTGMIDTGNQWPLYCIDWAWAAEELKMDYSEVEVDGTTYYFRSF